jgi:hypothetical protein
MAKLYIREIGSNNACSFCLERQGMSEDYEDIDYSRHNHCKCLIYTIDTDTGKKEITKNYRDINKPINRQAKNVNGDKIITLKNITNEQLLKYTKPNSIYTINKNAKKSITNLNNLILTNSYEFEKVRMFGHEIIDILKIRANGYNVIPIKPSNISSIDYLLNGVKYEMKAPSGTKGKLGKRTMLTNLKSALKFDKNNNIVISSSRLDEIDTDIIQSITNDLSKLSNLHKNKINTIRYLNKNNILIKLFENGKFKI